MTKLVWVEDYSVGVRQLDDEHKVIFKLMNTLVDLGQVSSSSEEIGDALRAMTKYASSHFDREEEYMRSIGFPDIERHTREHMVFSETTIEFCSEIMARSGGLPAKVLDYPRHWWVDHILESDMAYKKFVEGKG